MSLASTEYSLDHHTQPSSLFARTKLEEPFFWIGGVVAALAWFLAAGVVAFWPDAADEWPQTIELAWLLTAGGAVFGLLGLFGRRLLVPGARLHRLQRTAPWLVVLAVLLIAWELVTAKLAWLPVPFFAPPQALLEVFVDDWSRIGISLLYSLRLLATGYLLGAIAGFVTGVSIGWSQAVGYWVHPVLRLLGPLPATAWLPFAFFAFPSSSSASTFLIALATWFPVTVLTWSGVAAVDSAYYDVARTLGAKSRFLILKVAVPAAMPSVFVGLFMGLGASFSVLVVAEMLGVKAGLGWYLQWAQGWAAYANMYALLLVMAVVFSSIITLLFVVRDRTLAWQKGAVKW
ncbi:ABC transporter permease [Glaciimonas sp. PCH181]|uniref:ABC transporter permease n=1 Tax=Glaciimonas sp. PCH181 TaxID=2133943 RepID=UPI000D3BD00D|nr:ABC transporter permease subunit [Glaciimonas sp. PCH181]PUA20808.1 ABC transporter permease [Glaciimonas sp. PCH181]